MSVPDSLTFLSWNLAMLERPAAAPLDWEQEHTQAEVRDIVLAESPDVVTFQELPGVVPYVETHDMVRSNPRSHSGNLATLIGNDLMEESAPRPITVPGCGLLTVLADRVTIANVHLAAGPGQGSVRRDQLEAVVAAAPTPAVVIVGDSNTRLDEEDGLATLGLAGPRPPEPTWDSRRNRFRDDGREFVAFFTRAWTVGPASVTDLRVLSRTTVDVGDGPFHLSDHYALVGTVSLDSTG
ncbi:MAG: endonuclease/exonuclease/phosphatase family protein [Actinomycetota bacterium]